MDFDSLSFLYKNISSEKVRKKQKLGHLLFLKPYVLVYRRQFILALISLVGASFMVLVWGGSIRYLIDHGFVDQQGSFFSSFVLSLFILILLMALGSFSYTYYGAWLGERISGDLRQKIFNHVLKLEASFYEQIRVGVLISRLINDTALIQVLLGSSLCLLVRNALLFLGSLIMMLIISSQLMALCVLAVLFIGIPILFLSRRLCHLSKTAQEKIAEIGGYIDECLNNIRTIQSFTHEDQDRVAFQNYSQKAFKATIDCTFLRSLLAAFMVIIFFAAIASLLWYGLNEVNKKMITVGQLLSFIFYIVIAAGATSSFGNVLLDLQRAAGALERLMELLSIQPSFLDPLKYRKLPSLSHGIIAIHGVSFSYPSRPQYAALKNITLSINPGEKLAIVGPSGSGKRTIFSLLMRFYDPQGGNIYFDGVDIKETHIKDLRERIGLVSQEVSLFSASFYENILYGRPEASEEEVWQAINRVQFQDFLTKLPHGIHTSIGTKGVRLSEGQKQCLVVARAVLRNPSLLLLDETTNVLDDQTEKIIQQAIDHLTATRTTIVIARRLATVLNADRIIVLEKGSIRAIGTHAELVLQDEFYRNLAILQLTHC